MKNDTKYPNVRCDAHPGEDEPGYCVCQHVIDGAPVAHFEPATCDSLGMVVCIRCHRILDAELLVVCCAHSVRDSGWDKAIVQ